MSDIPAIPTLQSYPVLGDPDGISVQSGHYVQGSQVLAGQGAHIRATAASLSPDWRGAAAGSYQSFSRGVAGAFLDAAAALQGVGTRLARYAAELAGPQSQAREAADQSRHWHDQITLWSQRLNDAQSAETLAQRQLNAAERTASAAAAGGHPGATGMAVASARTALTTAQHDVAVATRQLRQAHDEFARWQTRAQRIQSDAHQLGADVSAGLLGITITSPPMAVPPSAAPPSTEGPLVVSPLPWPGPCPGPPVQLPATKKDKAGKGGKGGKGQPPRQGGSRGRPHPPSGTGKSGSDRHTKPRSGNSGKRPPYRKRPKGWQGPWPPRI